jgi:threonine synthase
VDGHGFSVTPFAPEDALGERLGMPAGSLWVKDETGNVSGSHKARHLFGLALALEVAERTGRTSRTETHRRGLAIASCGNAALAAAVVARAARRHLRVFIPTDAAPAVVARLHGLSAEVVVCRREAGVAGDPCMHAFHEAVSKGALPFCCQGSENGLCIEGGMTLAWEMVESLERRRVRLDRLFVQVGGGALASACVQGLRQAVELRALAAMPRIHSVQTQGAWPLRRAWEQLRTRISTRAATRDDDVAECMAAPVRARAREEAFEYASAHRGEFMWPWETTPHSLAHGILDDETYDWLAVTRGLVESGGWPVTVGEGRVSEAYELAREATTIPVDPTGTAGLAGLIELRAQSLLPDGEKCAVLFTGVER